MCSPFEIKNSFAKDLIKSIEYLFRYIYNINRRLPENTSAYIVLKYKRYMGRKIFMKRNFVFTVLLLIAVLATTVQAAVLKAERAPHIKIVIDGVVQVLKDANGNTVDPVIIDGTTYLPVRSIANAFGKEVSWDEKTFTATIGTGLAVKPAETPKPTDTQKVGVSMPTKELQRWNQDGDNLKKQLEDLGYEVDLQFANNEVATQVSQIENMILGGCKVLVIAPIDGSAFDSVLADAKAKGITVISYDHLIIGTDSVDYHATFDNYMVGTIQGKYIEKELGLDKGKGPFNIELITGDPSDTNAEYFFKGAMDVLNPYIKSGKLVVQSGQTTFVQSSTDSWRTETAQERFDNIITANYAKGKKLDAVMASNDSTAQGVTNALLAAGFTKNNFPIITGQDCDVVSMMNIIAGYQSMSVFKDTRTLVTKTVEMVDAVLKGKTVPINDTKTYDNGKKVVPSFLCAPVVVDRENYKEILIPNYYTEEYLAEWFN